MIESNLIQQNNNIPSLNPTASSPMIPPPKLNNVVMIFLAQLACAVLALVLEKDSDLLIMTEVFFIFNSIDLPPSKFYDLKSSFEPALGQSRKAVNKSYCFGTGREAFSKVVLPGTINYPDPVVPGPGTYNNFLTIGSDAKKFSMYEKLYNNDI